MDSDVDICVLCTDVCFTDYTFAPGSSDASLGLTPSDYTYAQFKNEVGQALRDFFGADGVTRGQKAFDVHANTYRVDADVVACIEHRQYENIYGQLRHEKGTAFYPDGSVARVVNWPQQHYDNGVLKNDTTGRNFKALVRILKRLRNEMTRNGIAAAGPIPSYLLECLAYNIPNSIITAPTWERTVRQVLFTIYEATQSDTSCAEWVEVNDRKYLLRGGQPWTRQHAHDFTLASWSYIGFD
jgi:hypothetical protein